MKQLLPLAVLVLSATSLRAQGEVRYFVSDTLQGELLGLSLDRLGDLNGDGFPELVVGAPWDRDPATGLLGLGSVRTYDGRTGAQLSLVYPPAGMEELGSIVRNVGDVNQDGVDDYGAGSNKTPKFAIYSGADHSLLHLWSDSSPFFGRELDAAGDWNGDGYDDVVIAEFKNVTHPGRVEIRSGLDGSVLITKPGDGSPFGWFGISVAGLGDLTGDGVRDIAVGASGQDGKVFVYSGATLEQVLLLLPPAETTGMGISVADAGDIDGDSIPDIVTGAQEDQSGAGSVFVFSGATGALLYQRTGDPGEGLGAGVAAAGDVDGDGVGDFVGVGGTVRIWSGADGSLLRRHSIAGVSFHSASPLGDVNDDGLADVAVGSADWFNPVSPGPQDLGAFEVVSACAAERYGVAPDATQTLSAEWLSGPPGAVARGEVRVSGATPSSLGILLAYSEPDELAGFLPELDLLVDPFSVEHFTLFFSYDAAGELVLPADLGLPLGGAQVYSQAFEVGAPTPSGLYSSNGLLTLFRE